MIFGSVGKLRTLGCSKKVLPVLVLVPALRPQQHWSRFRSGVKLAEVSLAQYALRRRWVAPTWPRATHRAMTLCWSLR